MRLPKRLVLPYLQDYLRDLLVQDIYTRSLRSDCTGLRYISPPSPKAFYVTRPPATDLYPVSSSSVYSAVRGLAKQGAFVLSGDDAGTMIQFSDSVFRMHVRKAEAFWLKRGYGLGISKGLPLRDLDKPLSGPLSSFYSLAYTVTDSAGAVQIIKARSECLACVAGGGVSADRSPEFDDHECDRIGAVDLFDLGYRVPCACCGSPCSAGGIVKRTNDSVFCTAECFVSYHDDPIEPLQALNDRLMANVRACVPVNADLTHHPSAVAVGIAFGQMSSFAYLDGYDVVFYPPIGNTYRIPSGARPFSGILHES